MHPMRAIHTGCWTCLSCNLCRPSAALAGMAGTWDRNGLVLAVEVVYSAVEWDGDVQSRAASRGAADSHLAA